jgi:hypothetical protein
MLPLQHFNSPKVPPAASCKEDRREWCIGAPAQWLRELNISLGASMSMAKQVEQHRYLITVDGVGCADRFGTLLGSSSAILKQISPYVEFWYSDLVPGVHYIPVRSDFSNLSAAVAEAESDGSAVQRMVLAANAYAQRFRTQRAKIAYLQALLKVYAARLHGDCRAPSNALPYDEWRRFHTPQK